jgi:hypothetical protein
MDHYKQKLYMYMNSILNGFLDGDISLYGSKIIHK